MFFFAIPMVLLLLFVRDQVSLAWPNGPSLHTIWVDSALILSPFIVNVAALFIDIIRRTSLFEIFMLLKKTDSQFVEAFLLRKFKSNIPTNRYESTVLVAAGLAIFFAVTIVFLGVTINTAAIASMSVYCWIIFLIRNSFFTLIERSEQGAGG